MNGRGANRYTWIGIVAIIASLAIVADCVIHAAVAQGALFPGPRGGLPAPQPSGLVGWLLQKQSEFYRQISTAVRAAKTDGQAIWTLLGLSFAYGVFHAAGPGHGKAVISSYLFANEETARRGVALSFASAMLQALVAVVLVGLGRLVFNVAAATMCDAERVVEIASYGLIALVGAGLVWAKGRAVLIALQHRRTSHARSAPLPAPATAHDHGHHDHHHAHDPHHGHHGHFGHSHGPSPNELAGPGGWRRGLSAIVAAGLRPCSGAILVLVFAFAQQLYAAGIAATFAMGIGTAITVATIATVSVSANGLARKLLAHGDGPGILVLRGLEFTAAAVVLLFGMALLSGYVIAERATCF